MQEVISESFGGTAGKLLFLKRSMGIFLGLKRYLNILKL